MEANEGVPVNAFENHGLRRRLWEIWAQISPYYQLIKKFAIVSIVVINTSCLSLGISAFLFGTIYFYHMPTIHHSFPLHFQYDRLCMQQHKVVERSLHLGRHLASAYSQKCFPVAEIMLSSPNQAGLLREGQYYSVVIKLELPETPSNLDIGMFMVNMKIQGQSTEPVQKRFEYRRSMKYPDRNNDLYYDGEPPTTISSSKAMTMRYKSPVMRLAHKLLFWPLLMLDFMHESQVLDEVLFHDIVLPKNALNWTAAISLETPGIDVYSAKLDVVAEFSGVQYVLYRWPIVSFIFGTAAFFLPVLFTILIMFFICVWLPFFSSVEFGEPYSPPRSQYSPPPSQRYPRGRQHPHTFVEMPGRITLPLVTQSEQIASPNITDSRRVEIASLSSVGGSVNTDGFLETRSRRSSSSSSIEMIDQAPNFSLADDQLTDLVDSSQSISEESLDENERGISQSSPDNALRRRQVD